MNIGYAQVVLGWSLAHHVQTFNKPPPKHTGAPDCRCRNCFMKNEFNRYWTKGAEHV